jgi:hypothetical protein
MVIGMRSLYGPLKRRAGPDDLYPVGWLDVLVAVLWTVFWLALAALVLLEGGNVVQACLVVVIAGAGLIRWLKTSWTLETLREWRRRASE